MDSILSAEHIFRRYITLPLDKIKQWSEQSSFQIDALGLVTLLGAEEVNLAVGNLQQRRYTECLPTLAAYVIAGDRFTTEQSGFVIYNLSDGITTTELKGWFTRWLMSQPMNNATTVFEWQPRGQRPQSSGLIAPALSFILVAPLLACAILIGDWYGVGTALAIILSIFVRLALLSQLRHARNKSAAPTAEATELEEIKDLCVIRCDGKMATIKAPATVLNTFTKDCEVEKKGLYKLTHQAGWLIFGVQVCILGMCTLFTQLYTVVLLVLSTWALSSNFPRDMGFRVTKPRNNPDFEEEEVLIPFSADWVVNKTNHPKKNREKVDSKTGDPLPWDRRKVAWARLGPDEKLMSLWNLFPYEANKEWRDDYNRLKAELRSSANEKRPGDLVTSHLISSSSTASTVGQSSSNLPQSKPEVPQHSTSNPSSLGTSTTNSTVVDGNTNAVEPASHL